MKVDSLKVTEIQSISTLEWLDFAFQFGSKIQSQVLQEFVGACFEVCLLHLQKSRAGDQLHNTLLHILPSHSIPLFTVQAQNILLITADQWQCMHQYILTNRPTAFQKYLTLKNALAMTPPMLSSLDSNWLGAIPSGLSVRPRWKYEEGRLKHLPSTPFGATCI